jgi:hypothetical protein
VADRHGRHRKCRRPIGCALIEAVGKIVRDRSKVRGRDVGRRIENGELTHQLLIRSIGQLGLFGAAIEEAISNGLRLQEGDDALGPWALWRQVHVLMQAVLVAEHGQVGPRKPNVPGLDNGSDETQPFGLVQTPCQSTVECPTSLSPPSPPCPCPRRGAGVRA